MNSKGIQKFFPKVTGADARARAVLAATLASFAHLGEESERNKVCSEKKGNMSCPCAAGSIHTYIDFQLTHARVNNVTLCWRGWQS